MVGCDQALVLAAGVGSLIPYLVKEVTDQMLIVIIFLLFIFHSIQIELNS